MVETTLDIGFSAAGESCVIASNVAGETEQQAELVAFAHYAARVISLLGPARAGAVVAALSASGDGSTEPAARGAAGRGPRAVVRFVDGASGPRIYFRLKPKEPTGAGPSVRVLLDALLRRREADVGYRRRLELAAELLARLGATGQVRTDNEFDVALAAADVGWRLAWGEQPRKAARELVCPACGNADTFELRVWPSETAVMRKCAGCGAGLWRRATHDPRLVRADIWSAMESMRAELSSVVEPEAGADGSSQPLLEELKRAFTENGWPYSEVRGAPVLLADLSGPAGRWSFYAQAVEEKDLILLYSICPQRVPEGRRFEVSHFLTRANYGLAAGNFELDFEDGEVRYKTALHVHGEELDGLTLKRLVRSNGIAVETYLPGIASVIAGTSAHFAGDL
jgi:Zn ribbon nucleic-acid-binding protein